MDAIREFNRFWTRTMGLLGEDLLGSGWSLTEVRVMYELAHGLAGAREIGERLGIDAGYLSRILARFRTKGLVTVAVSSEDARRRDVTLTARGKKVFGQLDARASAQVAELVRGVDQERLIGAMATIRDVMEPGRARAWELREPRPGDLGWIVERHGAIYAREYGWDARFEGLVAGVVAEFAEGGEGQRGWIAEVDGRRAGCVLCTRRNATTAQLRVLLVEPAARGLGIGGRLIQECIAFARATGYRKMMLWTNSVLADARRLYERAGFALVEEEPHDEFGEGLVGQTWELPL